MTILLCLVQAIRARWYSAAAALLLAPAVWGQNTPQSLADAVRAFNEEKYDSAAARLQNVRMAKLADYVAYYRGASRAQLGDHAAALKDFTSVRQYEPRSPLFGQAVVREAEALTALGKAPEAVRLLDQHYPQVPQPAADLAAAAAYEAQSDSARAADYYQRVYYRYPQGEAAMKAAAALLSLRSSAGDAYPPATTALRMTRIEALVDAREYARAKTELQELLEQLGGADRDLARVRLGAVEYARGNTRDAYRYLKDLNVAGEAGAERLYYLEECARRAGDDDEMLDHIKQLERKHEFSPWRLKALIAAGNRFLLDNNQDRYEDLFRAAYDSFPETTDGAYAHWKVAWLHYLRRKRDADDRLRAQLERFPSYNASAAAYFLGRLAEADEKYGDARAYYTAIVERFPHFYYGVLSKQRLYDAKVMRAPLSAKVSQFLSGLAPFQGERIATGSSTPATRSRLERARLLTSADLKDLAEAELRFGAQEDAQAVFMAIERASMEDSPFDALRAIKSLTPSYLSMDVKQAPMDFWRYLFPLPYQSYLTKHAKAHDLDSHMVAALIRQESEFNPRARSRKNALGLTQVLPSTGRQIARQVGIRRFSSGLLYQPEPNLRIGTYYLRNMLDQWGGKWEETLAAYNAGPSRPANWTTWADFREPAEFVETVPFTETREYIQAVVRNAALYRQIYQSGLPKEPEEKRTVKPVEKKPASSSVAKKRSATKKSSVKTAKKKAPATKKASSPGKSKSKRPSRT